MIGLRQLIDLAGINLGKFKIHCARGRNHPTPLERFFDGDFEEWQERQRQQNFSCENIVSLIFLHGDKWLFAGVYTVLDVKPPTKKRTWFQYSTEEVAGLGHLVGRVVVRFERKFRASYLKGEKYADQLIVSEIRAQRMSVGDFPGYNSVLLSHPLLCTIIRENLDSWRSALSNVSGVYVITDNNTGKLYVGSAYGGDGIWQRWRAYAKNGHGGNKELKALLRVQGRDHVQHLQFSVLEVCDLNASNDYIIARETHWKDVLRSREFGYNEN